MTTVVMFRTVPLYSSVVQATNEVIAQVPHTTPEELKQAVDSCQNALESWKKSSLLTRQQCMFKLQALIRRDLKKLAENITQEQGKTLPDAEGDVIRGLQVKHTSSLALADTLKL